MKKEYKSIFDKIEPDIMLEESVLDINTSKRVAFTPKRVLALVAVIAIMVTGGSFGVHQLAVKPVVTPSTVESINNSFSIVAYAKNGGEIKTISDVEMPLDYQIICYDIRGLSQDEIDKTFEKFKQEYKETYKENNHMFRQQLQRLDNALVGRVAWDCFDINVDDIDNVKSINVKNSSDYGEVEIVAFDNHYDDDGNMLTGQNGIELGKDIIRGNNISLSGDRFAKCKRLEEEHGKTFYLEWKMHDNLWQAIDKNPDMDLSTVSDTITITVEYKDGSIAQNKINISFDTNGKMSAVIDN